MVVFLIVIIMLLSYRLLFIHCHFPDIFFPPKLKLNSIWISDSAFIFLPTLCFRMNTGFPRFFALTVKEKQKLTKQITGLTG